MFVGENVAEGGRRFHQKTRFMPVYVLGLRVSGFWGFWVFGFWGFRVFFCFWGLTGLTGLRGWGFRGFGGLRFEGLSFRIYLPKPMKM